MRHLNKRLTWIVLTLSMLVTACGGGSPQDASGTDNTPPTVSFLSPADGQVVGAQIAVQVQATDASGIASVELRRDGVLIGTDQSAPYEFTVTTSTGPNTLTARATDASSNANWAESSIDVTRNGPSPVVGWDESDFAVVYEVGPNETIQELDDVPWESLAPDTLVKVHWRSAPYRSKFAINTAGSETTPVVLVGVSSNSGLKPVISGENASTRPQLSFSNQQRSIVKIGGSDFPAGQTASWVYIDNLVIRGANEANTFTDSNGATSSYSANAASVHVSVGSNLFVQNCEITDSGNGIFSGFESSNVVIRNNYIHGNGSSGSGQQHNTYTESLNITYEFNHFGPLRTGANGENLKDRSAGAVIRYNWIEGGGRQLDLVDSDHAEIYNDPMYAMTVVYGNILVEPNGAGNRNVVHYGGDLSGRESTYRKGTLYFYHNTVISERTDRITLFGPSTIDESIDARNNVIYSSSGGNNVAITSGSGIIDVQNNWLPSGWVASDGALTGVVNDLGNVEGDTPGFVNFAMQNYALQDTGTAVNIGGSLASAVSAYPVDSEYVVHLQSASRTTVAAADGGAFESGGTVTDVSVTTTSLANATVGNSYSATLSATGGVGPYTWSITTGQLPNGITLNSGSGEISGTPDTAGVFDITAMVTDSSARTAFASLTLTVNAAPPTGGLLDAYSATSGLTSLSFVDKDLSGVTYVADTNTYFLIQNSGGRIWEVDSSFNLLRTITAGGFGDTEDITYLGNNEFAIVVENISSIYIGTISPTTTSISPSAFQRVSFDSPAGNSGYEGVAFDPNTQTFWSVKEFGPKKIVKFDRPTGSGDTTVTPIVPFNAETLPAIDLSSVQFDSRTGNLLILSHESHKLMEVTTDGTVLSELPMADFSQHEGVTLDSSFDLVITSEPNLFRLYGQ